VVDEQFAAGIANTSLHKLTNGAIPW